jgi:hypothetical protein
MSRIMNEIQQVAHRFNVDPAALSVIVAEAVELVLGGMDHDAAFMMACEKHEHDCMIGAGLITAGQGVERMNQIIEAAGRETYNRLPAKA